jgi:hypothetical protein
MDLTVDHRQLLCLLVTQLLENEEIFMMWRDQLLANPHFNPLGVFYKLSGGKDHLDAYEMTEFLVSAGKSGTCFQSMKDRVVDILGSKLDYRHFLILICSDWRKYLELPASNLNPSDVIMSTVASLLNRIIEQTVRAEPLRKQLWYGGVTAS